MVQTVYPGAQKHSPSGAAQRFGWKIVMTRMKFLIYLYMHDIKNSIRSYRYLEEIGRIRLSENFLLRDFLHSEIASAFGLINAPSDLGLAVEVGTKLCSEILEPIQQEFGRISVRSGYRSAQVNALGHRLRLNCASNQKNAAGHIWDIRDHLGRKGATACLVIPEFCNRYQHAGAWRILANWIDDHLDYGTACFFPKLWAFNIQWHEAPLREIRSYAWPRGKYFGTGSRECGCVDQMCFHDI